MNHAPDYLNCKVLILGCGNILFGDDGFGPKVAQTLQKNYNLPENVKVLDAGSGVRNILFDIALSPKKPEKIIIVDAVDNGRSPGEIFELPIEKIPMKKIDDFSMHQLPTSNLLKELRDLCKVKIKIFVAQVEKFPDEVYEGLSKSLVDKIPQISDIILKECSMR